MNASNEEDNSKQKMNPKNIMVNMRKITPTPTSINKFDYTLDDDNTRSQVMEDFEEQVEEEKSYDVSKDSKKNIRKAITFNLKIEDF